MSRRGSCPASSSSPTRPARRRRLRRPPRRGPRAGRRTSSRRTARRCCSTSIAPWAMAWSSSDSESRIEPAPARAMTASASGAASIPSFAHTSARCAAISSTVYSVNSKCWVRDRMVGATFSGSVVASTNTTCSGASSSVFSSAASALAAEHVHLVEDVHLLRAAGAEVGDALEQVAHLVDLALRRGVDLDDVEGASPRRWPRSSRTRRTDRRRRPDWCSSGPSRAAGRWWSCPCPGARRRGTRDRPDRRAPRSAARCARAPARRARRTAAGGTCGRATGTPRSDCRTPTLHEHLVPNRPGPAHPPRSVRVPPAL